MSEVIDGLGPNGKLMVVDAAMEPIEVTPVQLITGSRTIQGWASGTPADAEDTLRFSELTSVRPMIETYPLEKAAEAYARMTSGNAQFRVVLTMGSGQVTGARWFAFGGAGHGCSHFVVIAVAR
jgi:D-arabinose 1-dehydrogenase-like Zn-dependent alcohol dehydrogenase